MKVLAKGDSKFEIPKSSVTEPTLFSFWCGLFLQKKPKYWLLGFVFAICWAIANLPFPVVILLGRGMGRLLYLLSGKLRKITAINIRLCFPNLNKEEQKKLILQSFIELGISIVETMVVWFGNIENLNRKRVSLEGKENWEAALDQKQGIVLLTCHYGSLDLNATLISLVERRGRTYSYSYRKPSDEIIGKFLTIARRKCSSTFYSVDSLMGICRALKNKEIVWYAPDIEVRRNQGIFADFFGVPALTSAMLGRLSECTNAIVVPIAHYRNADNVSYTMKIFPALKDFPSGDPLTDTEAQNRQMEEMISPYPARYWWAIKRFKRRPRGEKRFY